MAPVASSTSILLLDEADCIAARPENQFRCVWPPVRSCAGPLSPTRWVSTGYGSLAGVDAWNLGKHLMYTDLLGAKGLADSGLLNGRW